MNVAVHYPSAGAMHSPTKARQFGLDEGVYHSSKPDLAAPRFDNHDDFYAFLDSNRGPPSGMMMNPQQQQHQQQQAQRHSPDNISRPPVTNSFPVQQPARSRPPSYTGSRSEEMLQLSPEGTGKMHRQNGRRGNRDNASSGRDRPGSGPRPTSHQNQNVNANANANAERSPPGTAGSSTSATRQTTRAPSPDGAQGLLSAASAGAAIQRLKSPSVMHSVLQPLEHKVKEYEASMNREEEQMMRLDEELRVLQERRRDAEMRFLEAKAKHDDYRRQYHDVERALRGELPVMAQPGPAGPPAGHGGQGGRDRPVSYAPDEDPEDDDDLDEAPPPALHRRVHSTQSFGRTSQKTKGRFRFSLFGGDR